MRFKLAKLIFAVATTVAACAASGQSLPVAGAHVTKLDPVFMGNVGTAGSIVFKIDQDINGCQASNPNHFLLYIGPVFSGSPGTYASILDNDKMLTNSKAVFSTLQLALVAGNKVELTVFPIVPGTPYSYCPVNPVRLLNTY